MDYKKLIKTALLAGEMMIISGAEMRRVEDTMSYILSVAPASSFTVFAVSTGITVSLWTDDKVYTLSSRVRGREANLLTIYLVNNVSRDLSEGKIDIFEAYDRLCDIRHKKQYNIYLKFLAYMGVCISFTLLFGGNAYDFLASLPISFVMVGAYFLLTYLGLNGFFVNMFTTMVLVFAAYGLKKYVFLDFNRELLIISSIMLLLPGVAFTTAVRDILNGDYISGMGRMLEAIVTALSVAAGAGVAIWIFHRVFA